MKKNSNKRKRMEKVYLAWNNVVGSCCCIYPNLKFFYYPDL